MKKLVACDPAWEKFIRTACSRLKADATRARHENPWRKKMQSLAVSARYSAKSRALRRQWRSRDRTNWTWLDCVRQCAADSFSNCWNAKLSPWKKFAQRKATLAMLRSRRCQATS